MAVRTPKTRDALARLLMPLQLEAAVFERAVSVAAAESRNFSPAAPKSAPEFMRWARTIETVHEELMLLRLGWRRFDPENLPYFLQPALNLGVIVSSGNALTGVTYDSPSTNNPKGSAFARRVDDNGAVTMFGHPTDEGEVIVDDLRILLYHERDGFVHLELSRPVGRLGSFVNRWSERIIFPAFDLALGAFGFEEGGDEGDFSFKIARR